MNAVCPRCMPHLLAHPGVGHTRLLPDPTETLFSIYLVCVCVCTQSIPILCDPMDCRPPGSSVHGIFQARILKWVAMPFSRGYSQPRD